MMTKRWKKGRTFRLFTVSYFFVRSSRSTTHRHLQARIGQMAGVALVLVTETLRTHEQPIELKTFYTVINKKEKLKVNSP